MARTRTVTQDEQANDEDNMNIIARFLSTLAVMTLAACGGKATTVTGNATGGDGVGGSITPTLTVSGNCIATSKECPKSP